MRAAQLVLALAACTPAAQPAPVTPELGISHKRSLAPARVTFTSDGRTLAGYVYFPDGAGPFPAIVYNHGSEADPGKKHGQAQFFVPRGFVVFVPHRRGQGLSASAAPEIGRLQADSPELVAELVAQRDDVAAAIAFVSGLPHVDRARIAVVGCSLGGVESLLAAEVGTGIVAAIDFAGGAITWARSEALQDRMHAAARAAQVPVLFLQAENDYDTAPSRALGAEMTAAGKPATVHIYPPNGTSAEEGHAFCAGGDHPPWGAEVLQFLATAMHCEVRGDAMVCPPR